MSSETCKILEVTRERLCEFDSIPFLRSNCLWISLEKSHVIPSFTALLVSSAYIQGFSSHLFYLFFFRDACFNALITTGLFCVHTCQYDRSSRQFHTFRELLVKSSHPVPSMVTV